jgi:chemotaxis signal transduction protein
MTPTKDHFQGSSRRGPREKVILFSVAEITFAISATAIEEIRELVGLEELPEEALVRRWAKVKHAFERQGHRYFAVDARVHFHTTHGQPSRLMVLRHVRAAVMVDAIEGMREIRLMQALPVAFVGEERDWYRGLTVIKGKVIPVVKPEAFLSKAEATLLNASIESAMKGIAVTA